MAFPPKKDTVNLVREIERALEDVIYGSVEIYVQDSKVTQIAVRKTVKTNLTITPKIKQFQVVSKKESQEKISREI